MAARIRLARGGAKKRPFYRIVVSDKRSARDGDFIEKLGIYNPLAPKDSSDRVVLNSDRIKYWLGTGATPSERVAKLLVAAKLYKLSKREQKLLEERTKTSQAAIAKKKAEEEAKRKAEAEAKAAEEKAAAEAAKAAEEAKGE